MFEAIPVENLPQDPLLWGSVAVAFIGLTAYYLYGGFIEENYRKIKWFRRLFLPFLTPFIENVDDEIDDVDLSRLYVETPIYEGEKVLEVDVPRDDYDYVMDSVGDFLLNNDFRPEVLLTSLGTNSDGNEEVGNWVLTGPEKTRTDMTGLGRMQEILYLLSSKWQLHVRIFYDNEDEKLLFYAHHEYNPYNPLYAKKHFNGKDTSFEKGQRLFKRYITKMVNVPLKNYDYEIVDE